MGWLFFFFILFIVAATLLMFIVSRWSSRYVGRHIKGRLDAINAIVNDRQIPEIWLTSYRQRAARLVSAGVSENQLRMLTNVARKRCVANIQELIRFVEERGLSDSQSTKHLMLTALREEAARWEDETVWGQLVDLTAPAPERPGADEDPEA